MFKPKQDNKYDFILGRDILQEIGLDVLNSSQTFKWGEIEVPMVERNHWHKRFIKEFWKIYKLDDGKEDSKLLILQQEEELFAIKQIVAAKI